MASSTEQLRKRILSSMDHGPLDREALAELIRSNHPGDAHARRVFGGLGQLRESAAIYRNSDDEVQNSEISTQIDQPVAIKLPSEDPKVQNNVVQKRSQGLNIRGSKHDLARIKLKNRGAKSVLRLYGARPLTVRVVSVASGRRLRLIVEGNSVSSKVIQSKARANGVQVSHVKSGDRTILIVLELDDGWFAQDPRSRRDGAEVVFARR